MLSTSSMIPEQPRGARPRGALLRATPDNKSAIRIDGNEGLTSGRYAVRVWQGESLGRQGLQVSPGKILLVDSSPLTQIGDEPGALVRRHRRPIS